jgi:hypothetical protein
MEINASCVACVSNNRYTVMSRVIKNATAFVIAAFEGLFKVLLLWAALGVVVSYATVKLQATLRQRHRLVTRS